MAFSEQTAAWPRDRLLALEGSRNLRDLGGYPTQDGRQVKWGMLFRSGSIAGLTQADWEQLTARGVRALCDLRTTHERTHEPFAWAESPGLKYWARDYPSSFGELRKVMASDFPTGDAARAAMLAGFKELPFEQATAYRQIFHHLKDGDVPLLFNCSAGKDRAGTAAAIILSALGVPRDVVMQDFELTDELGNLRQSMMSRPENVSVLSRQPGEVSDAILRADPTYIATALASIDERHGSIEAYLDEVLSIAARDLETIRDLLLEPD